MKHLSAMCALSDKPCAACKDLRCEHDCHVVRVPVKPGLSKGAKNLLRRQAQRAGRRGW